MSTLYCDRQVLAIEREGASIVLRDSEGRRNNLPLNMLERIVIRGSVEIDTSTLAHLAEKGIVIAILSGRHHKLQAQVSGGPGKEALRRIGQVRAHDDPVWTSNWNRLLLARKLRSQRRMLQQALEQRPDCRHALSKGMEAIDATWIRLKSEHPDPATLLGMEGGAARVYFDSLSVLFPPSLNFSGRNRRPPRDPVNAVLSLGYTLLHNEAAQAAWATGLDPYIGFYHKPAHGRESLASDLIEPLRAHIDRLCWDLFRKRTLTSEHFSRQGKACLLNKRGRHHFYAAYEQLAPPMRRALRRTATTLAKRFAQYPAPGEENQ